MELNKVITAIVSIVFLFIQSSACFGENWPRFRGPTGLGYTEERNLPITWGGADKKNVFWEAPLKGQGHASPIVWGDLVFVCGVHWPETVRERKKVVPDQHVTCYRSSDGKMLWDTVVPPGPWLRTDFRSGPGGGYAAATPASCYTVYSGHRFWRHWIFMVRLFGERRLCLILLMLHPAAAQSSMRTPSSCFARCRKKAIREWSLSRRPAAKRPASASATSAPSFPWSRHCPGSASSSRAPGCRTCPSSP